MIRSLSLLLTVLALLTLTAIGAQASPPSAGNSTTPSAIRLVGASSGVPDASDGQFKIVIRGLANNPINGCSVVIDLSNCADLRFCSDQMDPGAQTNCTA